MVARIYQPAKTATQSGMARTKGWVLEYAPATAREVDPLMGWTSSSDTQTQVKLRFDTREAAEEYAREQGIQAVVLSSHKRAHNVRARGYAENFAPERRQVWTH
ncbi:MAG: ETC complex I subunit [Brevirhabdus sp.]